MKNVHVFALLAFAAGLFSCTSDVESAEDVLAQLGRSSSSGTESSSSAEPPGMVFCRYPNGVCEGPVSLDACNFLYGTPVQSCGTASSSSSLVLSSSSLAPSSSSPSIISSSSSSIVPSSSSALPSSSSSALPSSSSVYIPPSSSSQPPSSSSVVPSSSSALAVSNCEGMVGSTVAIGSQTWMKSNLNCDVSGSKCYGNDPANCTTYGRLYDWSTAMALPSSCNSSACSGQISNPHRGICPNGWHIPSNDDWNILFHYADGTSGTGNYDSPTAGRYLKATSGWNSCGPSGSGSSYLCEDAHGFSALPGGFDRSDGIFFSVGSGGSWWSSYENDASYAYRRYMYFSDEDASWDSSGKGRLFSVRCVKD